MHSETVADGPQGTSCASDAQRRFGGMARLFGATGAGRISRAHVAVVGLGGVGSWTAEALARSGVGRLTLVDLDHVAESNINRQVHALESTLGMAKVQAMAERIALIHPDCIVNACEEFADEDNLETLLPPGLDALVDACDQVRAKVALALWAKARRVTFVTVGAAGGKRRAHGVEVDDLARVTHDPLLAQMRYRWRRQDRHRATGKPLGLTAVFSREPVLRPQGVQGNADHTLNCHGYGSSVAVTASFGMCAAGVVLQKLVDE